MDKQTDRQIQTNMPPQLLRSLGHNKTMLQSAFTVNFFFLIWVLQPFQEYFTYIEPIVHQRWAKTEEPGEKLPDHP